MQGGSKMAVRNIREEGDPLLRKKSREITQVDDKVRELLSDMYDTLKVSKDGIGIAAPQVGILKRAIVIDLGDEDTSKKGPYKLVNPKIVKKKGEQICREGCLSVPGVLGDVIRPLEVTVEALNENGEKVVIKGRDIMAVVLCHEIDHLDGILFIDKATDFYEADEEEEEEKK